jgi:hypothetical protein
MGRGKLRKKRMYANFDILLTVHLSIFISVINQLDAQNFCFTISLFHASTCFEHMCSSSGGKILHYTASGVVTPAGGRLVHRLREDCQPVHKTATYRCDDTRCCVIEIWPPDDDHMCSKHVEASNKLIVKQKFCVSSWLITETNIQKKITTDDLQTLTVNDFRYCYDQCKKRWNHFVTSHGSHFEGNNS